MFTRNSNTPKEEKIRCKAIGKSTANYWKDPEYRRRQSISRKLAWKNKKRRQQASNLHKERWNTISTKKREEFSEKMRYSQLNRYKDKNQYRKVVKHCRNIAKTRDNDSWRRKLSESGRGVSRNKGRKLYRVIPYQGNFWCYYDGKQGKIPMRSGWEAAFATWCDDKRIKFKYEPYTFILKSGRSYTPDFYLQDFGLFVEVKGYMGPGHRTAKCFEFIAQYPKLRLLLLDSNGMKELLLMFCKKNNKIQRRK